MEIPKTDLVSSYKKEIQAPVVKNSETKADKIESKKEKKQNKKDFFDNKYVKKLGVIDDYARIAKPFLLLSKNPVLKAIAPAAYAASAVYMAGDVIDKYKKGEDGTGEKPSIKMGVRQALYQGAINIALPIGIVKATEKIAGRLINGSKTVENIKKGAKVAGNFIENQGVAKNFLKSAGAPAKIIGAMASIFVLSKAMKPISFLADKLFKITVDPLLKIGNKNKTEKAEKTEEVKKAENTEKAQ